MFGKPLSLRLAVYAVPTILLFGYGFLTDAASWQTGKKVSTKSKLAMIDSAEIHYNTGIEFYKAKNYDAAVAEFKEAIKYNPHHERAYKKLADVFKERKRLDEAETHFQELAIKYSQNSYPYFALGLVLAEQMHYQEAIENYKKSIQRLPQSAMFYASLVKAFKELKNLEAAIDFMNRRIKTNPQDPFAHYGLARAFVEQSKWNQALASSDRAIKLNRDIFDFYLLKKSIFNGSQKYEEGLELCRWALQKAIEQNDLEFKYYFLEGLGLFHSKIEQYQEALKYHKDALIISRQIGEKDDEVNTLNNIGFAYWRVGNLQEAASYFNQSLEICRALGLKDMEIDLNNLGVVYMDMGEYEKAIPQLREALNLARIAGNRKLESSALGNLSTVYSYQGDYPQAIEYAELAVGINREIGRKIGESSNLGNLGLLHVELGNYANALEYLSRALSIAEEVEDQYLQGIWRNGLGAIHSALGDQARALSHFEAALNISREIADKLHEGQCLANIGSTYWELGDTTKSINYFQQAMKLFVETGDRSNEGLTYANLAYAYIHIANYKESQQFIEQSLKVFQEIGNKYGESNAYNSLGLLRLKLKQYPQAIISHQKALVIAEEIRASQHIWEAKFGLARACEQQGNFTEALTQYTQAINTVETVRGQIPLEEQKAGFLESKLEIYNKLIHLLFAMNQKEPDKRFDAKAFHYAERAKARALLDILSEAKIQIREGIAPDLLVRQKEIFRNIAKIQTKPRSTELTGGERKELSDELKVEEENLEGLRLELRQKNPAYADLEYPEPLSLLDVQQKVLGKNDLLLEYSLGDENSYLWAITRENSYIFQLPNQKEITQKVESYLKMISKGPRSNFETLGIALFDILLKPANKVLKTKPNLIIIPDGILHYLPFEAMISHLEKNEPHYLIESKNISYAPSASVLEFIKNQMPAQTNKRELLAFGDPIFGDETATAKREVFAPDTTSVDTLTVEITERGLYEERGFKFSRLPHTAKEIEKIAAHIPIDKKQTYLRAEAKEERAKAAQLSHYRIMHFATHATLDEQKPGRSAIVLTLDNDPTEDGFLQMNEIFNLKLDADLVVLSACQTGRGKLLRGEGVIGMTRAFMYAGARSLLVSLWPVIDESTANFMANFYSYMRQGQAKNEALRRAKLDWIKGEKRPLRHPYYWAPFVLMGNSN